MADGASTYGGGADAVVGCGRSPIHEGLNLPKSWNYALLSLRRSGRATAALLLCKYIHVCSCFLSIHYASTNKRVEPLAGVFSRYQDTQGYLSKRNTLLQFATQIFKSRAALKDTYELVHELVTLVCILCILSSIHTTRSKYGYSSSNNNNIIRARNITRVLLFIIMYYLVRE